MKRLAGLVLGLALLSPTLDYQVDLFERAGTAVAGESVTDVDLRPPVDIAGALETLRAAVG